MGGKNRWCYSNKAEVSLWTGRKVISGGGGEGVGAQNNIVSVLMSGNVVSLKYFHLHFCLMKSLGIANRRTVKAEREKAFSSRQTPNEWNRKFSGKMLLGLEQTTDSSEAKVFCTKYTFRKGENVARRHKSKASGREKEALLEKLKPPEKAFWRRRITKENYFCHFLRIFPSAERQSGDAAMDSLTRRRQISHFTSANEDSQVSFVETACFICFFHVASITAAFQRFRGDFSITDTCRSLLTKVIWILGY